MSDTKLKPALSTVALAALLAVCGLFVGTHASSQDAAQAPVARRIGAIKSIDGSSLTLAPDSGPEIAVSVQPNARLLRIAPGEKDLKNAAPVQLQDLRVGDRIRVRGQASADASSIAALEVIVMARTDLDARHEQERQDWQKRGSGGLVSAVDAASGTVTISITSLAGTKKVAIHTSKSTVIRRYAPDSLKFDDAKPGALEEIHTGDQLRVRGDHNSDSTEMTAEEIVTGNFRNVAGTVNSVDAGAGTVNVQDVLTRKAVIVKITADSQLHKLPQQLAQMIAMRLKGAMPPGTPGAGGSSTPQPAAGGAPSGPPPGMKPGDAPVGGGMGSGMRNGDFAQMLSHMPAIALADLQKGDAVMIVATQGTSAGSTAITLLSGVEPILQASPSAGQASMLTPWSLGGAPGGDAQ